MTGPDDEEYDGYWALGIVPVGDALIEALLNADEFRGRPLRRPNVPPSPAALPVDYFDANWPQTEPADPPGGEG